MQIAELSQADRCFAQASELEDWLATRRQKVEQANSNGLNLSSKDIKSAGEIRKN
jgi:hypothetical protein